MSGEPVYSIYLQPERDAAKLGAVRDELLAWYEENGRDLPWRRTRDPWRILVSEVMLQQIQVRRAVPFYEAFVERFPTPRTLAEAPLAEAIRTWGDLGRYRRVVNLHRTARILLEEFGGEVPQEPAALAKLPGIGAYTAGAVACFAYEQDVAFLDTNARRVLHRVFFGADVPRPNVSERELLRLAEALVPRSRGWEWGQAVIELGAVVCAARRPACGSCSLRDLCVARHTIQGILATSPRAAGKADLNRYEGSNRYFRGRVLAALREASYEGIPMRELGEGLREGFGARDLPWLRGVVQSLQKDGLAVVEAENPAPAEVVAEARATYGTDVGAAGPRRGVTEEIVRLP